ncbi:hypothetical protein JCM5296_007367 [Sporobolomyces johnsonii]
MGNGAKAAQKREKNAANQKKGPTSQLAANAKAMTLVCTVCKSPFMSTSRAPALTEHAVNKHSKDLATCFPDFKA